MAGAAVHGFGFSDSQYGMNPDKRNSQQWSAAAISQSKLTSQPEGAFILINIFKVNVISQQVF